MRHVAASRPGEEKNKVFRKINEWLTEGNSKYSAMISWTLRHSKAYVCGIRRHSGRNIHNEPDRTRKFHAQGRPGMHFTVELELPEGATIERTREVTERAMTYLMADPDIEHVLNVTGSSPPCGRQSGPQSAHRDPGNRGMSVKPNAWKSDYNASPKSCQAIPKAKSTYRRRPSFPGSDHLAALKWPWKPAATHRTTICDRPWTP